MSQLALDKVVAVSITAAQRIRRPPRPTGLLCDEILSGLLGPVDYDSRGLFLVCQRRLGKLECRGLRLILATSLGALVEYLGAKPRGIAVTFRLANLRYPGQLMAVENYFAARIEYARP